MNIKYSLPNSVILLWFVRFGLCLILFIPVVFELWTLSLDSILAIPQLLYTYHCGDAHVDDLVFQYVMEEIAETKKHLIE